MDGVVDVSLILDYPVLSVPPQAGTVKAVSR